MRRILHVDMDAFYASVEQRDRPELRGRPVIVGADPRGGHGRGVVAACSYEARRFGVHSALPISQAWKRCRHGVYLRPRFERYSQVSGQIMEIFRRFTELVEPLSVDEAFLDVTGSATLMGSAPEIARAIKQEVHRETGLTASVGIATNKFLAKLASDLEKPDGMVLVPDEALERFLEKMPIERLWGVGPKTAPRLKRLGIGTIGDLAAIPRSRITQALGPFGAHLWELAHGRDRRPVQPVWEPRSIGCERTFEEDTQDQRLLLRVLRQLSDRVAKRLRSKGYRAGRITLKLRYASFRTYTRQVSLVDTVQTGEAIFEAARTLLNSFEDSFEPSEKVRLLGIQGGKLTQTGSPGSQMHLFPDPGNDERLARMLDEVHDRYGADAIRRGSDLELRS
jgi:DNA polymerase-4